MNAYIRNNLENLGTKQNKELLKYINGFELIWKNLAKQQSGDI